jgi:ubiquitin-conjugating enzyme E2 variant
MAQAPQKHHYNPEEYRVPRNFKLLDELESAEKGYYTDAKKYGEDCHWINLGLDGQDATFTHWNATIIPHQGGHIGDRIYTLKITAGPGYPDDAPYIRFIQKVSLPCVDGSGVVMFHKMSNFQWHRESSMFEVLLALRKEMQPAPIAQACARIPQDSTY